MRAPKRRRPLLRSPQPPPPGASLVDLAQRVCYVGSGEHKSYPSFAGQPRLRADASKCDPTFTDASEITDWVRRAIACGNVGAPWEGEFPRYVWHRQDDVVYEARLVNQVLGQYKGYPLDRSEWPEKLNQVSEEDER
jgi:hypothetical protein